MNEPQSPEAETLRRKKATAKSVTTTITSSQKQRTVPSKSLIRYSIIRK